MYFSCTITSLFVWEGKAKEKSLFSFSFLFCFCQRLLVLWRPVLMYVRSLLFDNKPDFYFVSCTLHLCCLISPVRPSDGGVRVEVDSPPQVQVLEYSCELPSSHTRLCLRSGSCGSVLIINNIQWNTEGRPAAESIHLIPLLHLADTTEVVQKYCTQVRLKYLTWVTSFSAKAHSNCTCSVNKVNV